MHGTIYKITNTVNNKVYIGQTIQNPKTRWMKHISQSKSGCEYPIYCAMRKYGIDNFSFEILESSILKEQLTDHENNWMQIYNSTDNKFGYNIGRGKDSNMNSKKKKVYQFDLNGNLVSEYVSIREAARKTGIEGNYISKCVNSKAHSAGKFIWKTENTVPSQTEIELATHSYPVLQYDKHGNFIAEHESTLAACYALGKQKGRGDSGISACLNGREKAYMGFLWRYKSNPLTEIPNIRPKTTAVCQYTKDGNLVAQFNTMTDAAKNVGGKVGNICMCCKGQIKSAYGFIWKYQDK